MRLLDRYLLRELLAPLGYCLAGFLIFFIAFDVLDELSTLQKLRLKGPDVALYFAVKVPEFIVTIMPIAFLLALLYTLTNLARHHEITAIRAAGVSLLRLSVPYVLVGFLLSAGVFAINELWAPRSTERAEEILNNYQPAGTAAHKVWEQRLGFISGEETRHWFIESFHKELFQMHRVHVDVTEPDGSHTTLDAERGWRETNTWVFTNVTLNTRSAAGETTGQQHHPVLAVPEFTESPEQILSEIKMARLNAGNFRQLRRAQLSIREILDYKRLHPGGTSQDAKLDTKLHGRFAAPWTCLVVVVIALPFGAAAGRRNVFVGVASSIVICFTYFVLGQTALALGTGGFVPGWVAAWAPNIAFGVTGLLLTLRVR